MFATGMECSHPTIDNGRIRRDLLEGTGHYRHWREDLLEEFGRITIVPHGEFLDVTERPAKLRFTIGLRNALPGWADPEHQLCQSAMAWT